MRFCAGSLAVTEASSKTHKISFQCKSWSLSPDCTISCTQADLPSMLWNDIPFEAEDDFCLVPLKTLQNHATDIDKNISSPNHWKASPPSSISCSSWWSNYRTLQWSSMLPNWQRQWIHLVSCGLEDLFFKPPCNLKELLHTILSCSRHVTLQGVHSGKQEKKTAQNPMSQFSGHKKNDHVTLVQKRRIKHCEQLKKEPGTMACRKLIAVLIFFCSSCTNIRYVHQISL